MQAVTIHSDKFQGQHEFCCSTWYLSLRLASCVLRICATRFAILLNEDCACSSDSYQGRPVDILQRKAEAIDVARHVGTRGKSDLVRQI